MKAVITADIVDYTKLTNEEADDVLIKIHHLIDVFKDSKFNIKNNFYIRRGDSIQGELANTSDALKLALLLKTGLNSLYYEENKKRTALIDVRIAIGIGGAVDKNNINESYGDAYTYSGRTLDEMKKNKRMIALKTDNEEVNAELETELKLLEVIMSGWTVRSAEILYWTILGDDEIVIANKLGISQPAVNQAKKRAGWIAVEALLERFENVIGEKNIEMQKIRDLIRIAANLYKSRDTVEEYSKNKIREIIVKETFKAANEKGILNID